MVTAALATVVRDNVPAADDRVKKLPRDAAGCGTLSESTIHTFFSDYPSISCDN
jgi:hypothetical protein